MADPASWTCNACTFINEDATAPVCEMCGTPNADAAPPSSPVTTGTTSTASRSMLSLAFAAAPPPPPAPIMPADTGLFTPSTGASHPVETLIAAAEADDVARLRKLLLEVADPATVKPEHRAIRGSGSAGIGGIGPYAEYQQASEYSAPLKNVLHAACAAGSLASVVLLVAEFGFSLTTETIAKGVAMHFAAEHGRDNVVRYLLTFGLEASGAERVVCSYSNAVPTTAAAEAGQVGTLRLLLEAGCDANACDSTGLTPLHFAVDAENGDMLELCLAHGASPLAPSSDDFQSTPLSRAIRKKNAALVARLFDAMESSGGSGSGTGSGGGSAAGAGDGGDRRAIQHGWITCVRFTIVSASSPEELSALGFERLCAYGSRERLNFNDDLRYRGTPLHMAVKESQDGAVCTAAVKALLAAGSNPSVEASTFRKDAIALAKEQGESRAEAVALMEAAVSAGSS